MGAVVCGPSWISVEQCAPSLGVSRSPRSPGRATSQRSWLAGLLDPPPHGCSRRTRQVQSKPWLQVLVPGRWHPPRKLRTCVFLKVRLCGGFPCSQRKSLELPPSPAWPALRVLPDMVDRDPLPARAQSLLIPGARAGAAFAVALWTWAQEGTEQA